MELWSTKVNYTTLNRCSIKKFPYRRLESAVLRYFVSLIQEALFLLSAQITELLTVFLCQCSKFLPVLDTFRQNLLPVAKAQSACGGQVNPSTLSCLLMGIPTAFTREKVYVHLCSPQYVTIIRIETYCSKTGKKTFLLL